MFIRLLIAATFSLFSHSASALWLEKTHCELFDSSNIIVSGKFIGSSVLTPYKGAAINIGVIQVNEVIKGQTGNAVLIQQPLPQQPKLSSDLMFNLGDIGIWLLRPSNLFEEGLYHIVYPQQFLKDMTPSRFSEKISPCH